MFLLCIIAWEEREKEENFRPCGSTKSKRTNGYYSDPKARKQKITDAYYLGYIHIYIYKERDREKETSGLVLGELMLGIFFFWSQLPNISFLIKLFWFCFLSLFLHFFKRESLWNQQCTDKELLATEAMITVLTFTDWSTKILDRCFLKLFILYYCNYLCHYSLTFCICH